MTDTDYWIEQMVFHGNGAYERAQNWSREIRERWIDGIRYVNVQHTVVVTELYGSLATRHWQVLPDGVLIGKPKRKKKRTHKKAA